MCKARSKVTPIKQQKICFYHLKGRGYNKNCVLYPRPLTWWKQIFADWLWTIDDCRPWFQAVAKAEGRHKKPSPWPREDIRTVAKAEGRHKKPSPRPREDIRNCIWLNCVSTMSIDSYIVHCVFEHLCYICFMSNYSWFCTHNTTSKAWLCCKWTAVNTSYHLYKNCF